MDRSSIAASNRRKYDSLVVYLYANNKEQLLPETFRDSIPSSTASDWRNCDYNDYYGAQYRYIQQEAIEYYELFAKYRNLQRTVKVLAKAWITVSEIIQPVLLRYGRNNERTVDALQQLMVVFPKKMTLKLVGLSASAWRYRLDKLRQKCEVSPFQLCIRTNPMQLSVKEVNCMKTLLADPDLTCWPLSSIAWHAKREKLVMASLSTWYKYAPMLGWKRHKWPPMKQEGVTSKQPNEYLHADTTYYKLEDGRKAAAVMVSDNFSKAILGSITAQSNGAVNVVEALKRAVKTMKQHHPHLRTASLIVDGGSENHAEEVTCYLNEIAPPEIRRYIALKDVQFSNSPVEAINKILKRYLRHFKLEQAKATRLLQNRGMVCEIGCKAM